MIKTTRIGSTLVCIINNKIYQKVLSSDQELIDLYERIGNTDETNQIEVLELINIFQPQKTNQELKQEKKLAKLEEEAKQQEDLLEFLAAIRDKDHDEPFEVIGNKFYVKGINITVPEFLIEEFRKRFGNQEDTNSLINFWRRLSLNSDPRCREDLYSFLMKNDISLTPSGLFIAYRNVNIKEENNKEFNDYIARMWMKVKQWKKSTKNYYIVKVDGELDCIPNQNWSDDLFNTTLGCLEDLYQNLSKEEGTTYTDAHTGKFEIKLGKIVSMERTKCNADPDQTCSSGLHLGNLNFMSKGSFGKEGIVCLCDPRDVVAVPTSYDGKLRTCSYLPISIAEYDDNNKIIPINTSTFECDYSNQLIEDLEKLCGASNFESLKEHEIIPKEIDIQSLKNILQGTKITMEEMNTVISNKVIKVNV